MTVALKCESLTSGYGGVPVVRNLDLEVHEGEVVVILGPNGAGKTTTLLTLAGVLAPIVGTVSVFGQPVEPGKPHLAARRGVSLVPDHRSMFYGLTTEENLRLALGRSSRAAALDAVLEYFPVLASKLRVRAGSLSGGEQQMLAIGRAFASGAKALMIDEMTLGLAPVIAQSILPIVRHAADQLGAAMLIVEQHVDLALQVADRVYVLNHGELHLTAPAAELVGRRDLLKASYLGEVSDVFDDRRAFTSKGLPT